MHFKLLIDNILCKAFVKPHTILLILFCYGVSVDRYLLTAKIIDTLFIIFLLLQSLLS